MGASSGGRPVVKSRAQVGLSMEMHASAPRNEPLNTCSASVASWPSRVVAGGPVGHSGRAGGPARKHEADEARESRAQPPNRVSSSREPDEMLDNSELESKLNSNFELELEVKLKLKL